MVDAVTAWIEKCGRGGSTCSSVEACREIDQARSQLQRRSSGVLSEVKCIRIVKIARCHCHRSGVASFTVSDKGKSTANTLNGVRALPRIVTVEMRP